MADTTLPGLLATGDHASRPAASAVGSGALYSCTTHSLVYQSDRSAWSTWATLATGDVAAHLADALDAHDASAISVADAGGYFTGADVEAALQELGAGGGGGGVTQSYIGYNTAGGSWEPMAASRIYLKKVTLAATTVLLSIDAYIKGNASNVRGLGVSVWTDSAGVPSKAIAENAFGGSTLGLNLDTTGRWFTVAIGPTLAAGDYWLGVQVWGGAGVLSLAYDGSGTDKYIAAGGEYLTDDATSTATTNKWSIRGNTIS